MRCRTVAVCLFALPCLIAPSTRGQTPPAPDDPEASIAAGSAHLLPNLAARMLRRPVVAVGPSNIGRYEDEDNTPMPPTRKRAPPKVAEDRPILERLQEIAEAASTESRSYIPFSLRATWVVAPETREDLNPNIAHTQIGDVTSRGRFLMTLLRGLSSDQLARVGTERGLPVSSLSLEQRSLLERALRLPLKARWSSGDWEPVTDAPDWSRARLRARLRTTSVHIVRLPESSATAILHTDDEPTDNIISLTLLDISEGAFLEYPRVPAYADAPNRLRPSDLSGETYRAPIGLQGVMPLRDVLKRASAATGLRLAADAPFRDIPVFIGSEKIPAGDVLDALALGVTGAWRKLGDTYILVWDRRGVAAVQRMATESAAALTKAIRAALDVDTDEADRRLALALPFDPDDPLALTDDQRKRLTDAVVEFDQDTTSTAAVAPNDASIPFFEMTPAQQEAFRKAADSAEVIVRGAGRATPQPLAEADLHSLRLSDSIHVSVTLDWPGRGWTAVHAVENSIRFSRRKDMAAERARQGLEAAPAPFAVDAPVRGVAVPVLGPARVSELADQMARAGLNTLFYPALFGGYATLPGKAFPLHPALRVADGMAAAVAAMKPKGIRVVAYLHTLAWQESGDTPHWLDRHPDWLDQDVLGRPRLAWLSGLDKGQAAEFRKWRNVRNYVRASEPKVVEKLNLLIEELRARPDVAGLAFAEWAPLELEPANDTPPAPHLGYAMPDRLAAFAAAGVDPVDIPEASAEIRTPGEIRRFHLFAEETDLPDPRTELLSTLLKVARLARPDWAISVWDEPNGTDLPVLGGGRAVMSTDAARPRPPLVLSDGAPEPGGAPSGLLITLSPRALAAQGAPDAVQEEMARRPSLQQRQLLEPSLFRRHWPAVVLDFRTAPEEIADSLRLLRPSAPEVSSQSD